MKKNWVIKITLGALIGGWAWAQTPDAESVRKPEKPPHVQMIFNFDKDKEGDLPDSWRARGPAGGQPAAEWKIVADASAPSPPHVLALTKLAADPSGFNLVTLKTVKAVNYKLGVRLKALSGKEDQGGGLIWRVQDDDNYYLARINPLEGNFRVYKVVAGKRTQLGTVDLPVEKETWYTMQVIAKREYFICTVNQTWTLQIADSTFGGEGSVGVWTKADAMTAFDDLELRITDKAEQP